MSTLISAIVRRRRAVPSVPRQRANQHRSCLLAAALLLGTSTSLGQVCFPTPVALPGLSGPPNWVAPGVVRPELNEPRWAAAPQLGFESDATGLEGLYRIIYDPAASQLSVSFQAPTDPGVLSGADSIYFGFTTDGTTATLAKAVRINLPPAGTDPILATNFQRHVYNAGGAPPWVSSLGRPDWIPLNTASAWRSDATAAWGINFKVDLVAAGINPANPFKIMLAMHKRDEAAAPAGVNVWTPDPGANPLLTGTLIIQNPTLWSNAAAPSAGCVDGIVLNGNQIGTRNIRAGNPAPHLINTTSGAVNRFYAQPTIPATITPFAGMFQAKFHIANWGSIAASNAPWTAIPGGGAVLNGMPPAATNDTVEFSCPANTATQTCGMAVPAEIHQCVYVELKPAPGQNVKFTKAAAYRNMDFQALSNFTAPAEISVKGLKKVFGDDQPRDVYVYVHAKNMPSHGDKPQFLRTDLMSATRRFAEAPPLPILRQPPAGRRLPGAAAAAVVAGPVRDPKKLREIPLPNTGVRDLDLNVHQALSTAWPTYDVHVYYDTGKTILIDKEPTKHLAPMYPFTYFHSHEGPLFGFSHALKGLEGAQVKELRPNVFLIRIPSEGVAKISTSVVAHEKGLRSETQPPPGGCPTCPAVVDKGGRCNCRVPGGVDAGGAPWWLAIGTLVMAVARRRRRSSAA